MNAAAVPDDAQIRFDRVRMSYPGRPVFESLSCSFPGGKVTVILGGSGSGKSTILRLVGGLIHPQAGRIFVEGEDVTRLSERGLYRVRQKLGMMFQGGALLDSLTVFDNLAFPLREHTRQSEADIGAEVHDRLRSVGLGEDVGELLPNQLSGGMVRRVALARAMMRKPTVLLCDEPFSGLDPATTKRIESLLVEMNRDHGMTIVAVSHHIPSTMRMADHVLMLLPWGAAEGSPEELQESADARIVNFLSEEVSEDDRLVAAPDDALPGAQRL